MSRRGECPFCQQRYSHDVRSQRYGNALRYWVRCDNCGATGPKESTAANAIYLWEKASVAPAEQGDNDRLRKLEQVWKDTNAFLEALGREISRFHQGSLTTLDTLAHIVRLWDDYDDAAIRRLLEGEGMTVYQLDIPNSDANRIVAALKAHKMSKAAFARSCGCSASNIYYWLGQYAWLPVPKYIWEEACRLFSELKEADGIVTTQWVTDQKRELTQDTTTYRKLITQEWPDKQEAEGE